MFPLVHVVHKLTRPAFGDVLVHASTVTVGSCNDARRVEADVLALVLTAFPERASDLEYGSGDIIDNLCGFHEPNDCLWLLCFISGRLCAFAMVVEYHDSLYVSSLAVHASLRGCGLGSHIMRSASALAASRGLPKVSGSVSSTSPHLARLYARLGGVALPPPQSSGDTVVPSQRWEAPSGRPTAHNTRVPIRCVVGEPRLFQLSLPILLSCVLGFGMYLNLRHLPRLRGERAALIAHNMR